MRKYIKLIPLILYPYAYLVYLAGMLAVSNDLDAFGLLSGAVFVGYNVYVLGVSLYDSVVTAGTRYTVREVAKINLTIR